MKECVGTSDEVNLEEVLEDEGKEEGQDVKSRESWQCHAEHKELRCQYALPTLNKAGNTSYFPIIRRKKNDFKVQRFPFYVIQNRHWLSLIDHKENKNIKLKTQ